MFTLRRPSDSMLAAFRLRQARLGLTDAMPGCTQTETCPPGHDADHTRACLGSGGEVFAAAKDVLLDWQQFPRPWVEVIAPRPPIEVGQVVVVLAQCLGFWVRNACRVIDLVDEPNRWALTYATLPGHVESGEERFQITREEDDQVWYDILPYSRPGHPLTRLGYPVVRRLQRRFARDSVASVKAGVARRLSLQTV